MQVRERVDHKAIPSIPNPKDSTERVARRKIEVAAQQCNWPQWWKWGVSTRSGFQLVIATLESELGNAVWIGVVDLGCTRLLIGSV
jgi:hypothetical protein